MMTDQEFHRVYMEPGELFFYDTFRLPNPQYVIMFNALHAMYIINAPLAGFPMAGLRTCSEGSTMRFTCSTMPYLLTAKNNEFCTYSTDIAISIDVGIVQYMKLLKCVNELNGCDVK